MARLRSPQYSDLPQNLVYDKSHKAYRYRRPDTNKTTYFGTDKYQAINAAKQLNNLLMPKIDLVAKALGLDITLKQFIQNRFLQVITKERVLSSNTVDHYKRQLKTISEKLGYKQIDRITIKDVSDFLMEYQDKPTQFNRYRNLLGLIVTTRSLYRQTSPANAI